MTVKKRPGDVTGGRTRVSETRPVHRESRGRSSFPLEPFLNVIIVLTQTYDRIGSHKTIRVGVCLYSLEKVDFVVIG